MANKTPITIAFGDGIGPEIMRATLDIILAGGAQLEMHEIEIGEKMYNRGVSAGIETSSWQTLLDTRVFLKAPITTPQGGGFKSLNVTARKTLGLYANLRPAVAYAPFVETKYPGMDVVVVRENEEDLYGGIEHRQTAQVMQCLKLISRPGCEKIVRYAFEYARANGRKKVTCFTKDNIMKMTDGLFHKVFDEIAPDYPEIENEHWIVDIGTAKLADTPELFDVIVTLNLYGDIISDVTAQIAGSVGLAGSANIGERCAMFEAIHGSAPRRAGQNVANPSGLLHGAILMLVHIGQTEVATKVHNAWLRTIEDGVHTYDIFTEGHSKEKVGTKEFAQAVIARLGQLPGTLKPAAYSSATPHTDPDYVAAAYQRPVKQLVGCDVFIDWAEASPDHVAKRCTAAGSGGLMLRSIANRGVKVWPDGIAGMEYSDHWACRFLSDREVTHAHIADLLGRIAAGGLDFVHVEALQNFNGERGFSLGQGE